MGSWFNQHQSKQPSFKVGDLVMLDNHHVATKHPSRKLNRKKIGIWKILEAVSNRAYHLELPAKLDIHNVIHVSVLKPYCVNLDQMSLTSTPQYPIPEIIAGEENWLARAIVESQRNKRKGG